MLYNSTIWQTGDIVTANKLNNIEQQLIVLDTALNENSSNIDFLNGDRYFDKFNKIQTRYE